MPTAVDTLPPTQTKILAPPLYVECRLVSPASLTKPGLKSNVGSCAVLQVGKCPQCQRTPQLRPLGLLSPVVPKLNLVKADASWDLVEIDLIGPFTTTTAGNNYIFTATDLFTKFVYARPIKVCSTCNAGSCGRGSYWEPKVLNVLEFNYFIRVQNRILCINCVTSTTLLKDTAIMRKFCS